MKTFAPTKFPITAAVIAAVALAFSAAAAAAQKWDMPTPYPDKNFHTQNIKRFAQEVAEATGGELEIVVHPAGSLIKHAEIKNAVRGGQVAIGEFFLSRLSNEHSAFGADSLPFLAADYAQAEKLWKASRPVIDRLLARQRLAVLFATPWPPQGLYAQEKITGADDLRGVKFRAYNALTERFAELAGAAPTQIEVPDIPQAFATGRVEAMITSPSTGANSAAWDFVSHFYDVQAWLPKNIVVVNQEAFDALSDSAKAALMKAAANAENRGWESSMKETAAKIKILRDNGMTVAAPSPQLRADMEAIGKVMVEEWLESTGAEGREILDAYRR